MLTPEVADERERCALLTEELASRWEHSAVKIREKHVFYTGGWLFPKREHVYPAYESMAKDIEAAAHGLRTVARGIREGWDTRKFKDADTKS